MRKPAFCICENKAADQLCGNRTADQRLCFRYIEVHTLGNKVEISKIKATVSADTESLVIYSGHGYMTYDNK